MFITGNEEASIQLDSDLNTYEPGSLCNYEFRFPENAAWGSSFQIQISGLSGSDLYFLTGSSIEAARGRGDGPYRDEEIIEKLVYYPDNAYLTFKNSEQIEVENQPLTVSFKYIQSTGVNSVTEAGGALPVIEEKSL